MQENCKIQGLVFGLEERVPLKFLNRRIRAFNSPIFLGSHVGIAKYLEVKGWKSAVP